MSEQSEDLKAELERLKAENEALKKTRKTTGSMSFKVSEKGAVSVYGLGRFPVTLYNPTDTSLLGTIPKMFLPFVVILPGIAAVALAQMTGAGGAHLYDIPLKAGSDIKDYDQVLTTLMARFYPSGLLGVGLAGLGVMRRRKKA